MFVNKFLSLVSAVCLRFALHFSGGPAAIRDLETPKYLRIEEDEPETWTQTVRVKIFTLFCENNNISYIFKLGNRENH